jgi:hypothetical protein
VGAITSARNRALKHSRHPEVRASSARLEG